MPDQLEPKEPERHRMDLGDTSYDPDLDGQIDVPLSPVRAKDPKTGQFLPAKPADASAEIPQTTKHQHPKALISRARDLGYTPTEIEGRDTNTLLEEVHAEEARELRELRRQALHQKSQDTQPTPFERTNNAVAPEDQGLPEDLVRVKQFTDPELFEVIKRLHDKNVELEKNHKALAEMEQNRQNMSRAQVIDQTFNSLGLSHIFGKGTLQDVDERSKNLRLKIVRLAAGEDPKDSLQARIARVAKELYGDFAQAPTRDVDYDDDPMVRRGPTRQEWDEAALTRPDNRSPHSGEGLPKGEQRALQNASRKLGHPVNDSGDEKSRFLGN